MGELIAVRRRLALFFGLFVFVIALLTTQARSPDRRQVGAIGSVVLTVLLPVQTGMARVADAFQRMWGLYTEIGRLRVENARLRETLDGMARRNAALQEQAQATQRLERLLEFRGQMGSRSIAATVIGRDVARWFGTVQVDRGARD